MSTENSDNTLKSKKRKAGELRKEIPNHKNKSDNDDDQILWSSIAKNYEMIQGAQIANRFIFLMVLSNATEPSSTTQISEIISKKSRGDIFKLSSTLKDSLEYRLKRDGYVEGIDMKNKSLYSITPKGRKLLKGWIAFLSAYRYLFEHMIYLLYRLLVLAETTLHWICSLNLQYFPSGKITLVIMIFILIIISPCPINIDYYSSPETFA